MTSNGGGGGPPPPAPNLAALVADQNLTATLKVLEAAIGGAEADYCTAKARLAQLHVNKGYCHQCLSLSRKALRDYDAALAIAPGSVLALFRRGQVLQTLNKNAVRACSLPACFRGVSSRPAHFCAGIALQLAEDRVCIM